MADMDTHCYSRANTDVVLMQYKVYITKAYDVQVSSVTCNMVTTCLSPVLVQMGAIPNFRATNPTLRVPFEWTDDTMLTKAKDETK